MRVKCGFIHMYILCVCRMYVCEWIHSNKLCRQINKKMLSLSDIKPVDNDFRGRRGQRSNKNLHPRKGFLMEEKSLFFQRRINYIIGKREKH